jgi:hypothetical protein
MRRLLIASLFLTLTAPARSAEVDPEPPQASTARSGDITVRIRDAGDVTATGKDGKTLWTYRVRNAYSTKKMQVAIGGDRVVVAQQEMLTVLDLKTGKAVFFVGGGIPKKATLRVKDGKISMNADKSRFVVDLQTGRLLERVKGD